MLTVAQAAPTRRRGSSSTRQGWEVIMRLNDRRNGGGLTVGTAGWWRGPGALFVGSSYSSRSRVQWLRRNMRPKRAVSAGPASCNALTW